MSEKPKSADTHYEGEKENNLRLLSTLIADIENHNKDHGYGALWGKTIARGLTGVMEDQTLDFEKAQEETAREMSASTHVNLTELQARHKDTLETIGLDIAHKPSRNDSENISGEVYIKLSDAEKFLSYLKSLTVTELDRQTVSIFQSLIKNLEYEIHTRAREGTLADYSNTFDQLGEISQYFSAVSPELDLTLINTYKKFNDTGRLEEYIIVDQEGLWDEPGLSFGPADWVKDITPEGLKEKWEKALEILNEQEAKQNLGVAPELREHLLKCITIANDILDTLNWGESTKVEMRKILSAYTQKLRGSAKLN